MGVRRDRRSGPPGAAGRGRRTTSAEVGHRTVGVEATRLRERDVKDLVRSELVEAAAQAPARAGVDGPIELLHAEGDEIAPAAHRRRLVLDRAHVAERRRDGDGLVGDDLRAVGLDGQGKEVVPGLVLQGWFERGAGAGDPGSVGDLPGASRSSAARSVSTWKTAGADERGWSGNGAIRTRPSSRSSYATVSNASAPPGNRLLTR